MRNQFPITVEVSLESYRILCLPLFWLLVRLFIQLFIQL